MGTGGCKQNADDWKRRRALCAKRRSRYHSKAEKNILVPLPVEAKEKMKELVWTKRIPELWEKVMGKEKGKSDEVNQENNHKGADPLDSSSPITLVHPILLIIIISIFLYGNAIVQS